MRAASCPKVAATPRLSDKLKHERSCLSSHLDRTAISCASSDISVDPSTPRCRSVATSNLQIPLPLYIRRVSLKLSTLDRPRAQCLRPLKLSSKATVEISTSFIMENVRGDPSIQELLLEIQQKQAGLQSAYDTLNARLDGHASAIPSQPQPQPQEDCSNREAYRQVPPANDNGSPSTASPSIDASGSSGPGAATSRQTSNTARIILTYVLCEMIVCYSDRVIMADTSQHISKADWHQSSSHELGPRRPTSARPSCGLPGAVIYSTSKR